DVAGAYRSERGGLPPDGAGAEDPGHALLPEQDPDGGVGGDRHLPGPGVPPGEKRSAADPQRAVNFGRGGGENRLPRRYFESILVRPAIASCVFAGFVAK